jgi:hypothetical protein
MILSKGNQNDKNKDEIDQNQLKTELSKNLDNAEHSKIDEDETAKMLPKEMSNITEKFKTNPGNKNDKTGKGMDQTQSKTEENKNSEETRIIEESTTDKEKTVNELQKEMQSIAEKRHTNPDKRNRVKTLVKEKLQATPEQRKPEIEKVCLNEKLQTNPDRIKPQIANVCLKEMLQTNLETLKSCLKIKEKNNDSNLEVEKISINNEKVIKMKNETEPTISMVSLEKTGHQTEKVNFPIKVEKLQNRPELHDVEKNVLEKSKTVTPKSDLVLNETQIFEKRKENVIDTDLDDGKRNVFQSSPNNQINLKRKLSNSEDNQRQIKHPKVTIKKKNRYFKTEGKVVKSNLLEKLVA